MLLTSRQNEGLKQFLTQGFVKRTQKNLADITSQTIEMDMTEFSLHPLNRLGGYFSSALNQEMVMIHQNFRGTISGDLILLLDRENALNLSRFLHQDSGGINSVEIGFSDQEVLREVGNLLLNNYLAMLNHILQLEINFSLPFLKLEPLTSLLNYLVVSKTEVRYSLVSESRFIFADGQFIIAHIILISGVLSLSVLLKAVETWENLGNPADFSKTHL